MQWAVGQSQATDCPQASDIKTYQESKILILTFCYKNYYILPDKEL